VAVTIGSVKTAAAWNERAWGGPDVTNVLRRSRPRGSIYTLVHRHNLGSSARLSHRDNFGLQRPLFRYDLYHSARQESSKRELPRDAAMSFGSRAGKPV
jgi:hypothetical protein